LAKPRVSSLRWCVEVQIFRYTLRMSEAQLYDLNRLRELAGEIITNVREMSAAGWTPATSSNFSCRLDDRHTAITVSGRDKGRLMEADIMVVDFDGKAVGSDHRPSAETLLHIQLYRRFAEIGCVLHTHSPTQTVASRLYAKSGHVRLEGYELLKAFAGNTTHDMAIEVPVLANTQDIPALAAQVEALLDDRCMWGYLIDGHGLYAWGRDMAEARRHIEAFEFLLGCELELRRLK
jgi:methylthioribulose-1-phosphate dehydratase